MYWGGGPPPRARDMVVLLVGTSWTWVYAQFLENAEALPDGGLKLEFAGLTNVTIQESDS